MQRAAHAATIGFAALAAFQAVLAAGAPLGGAAWGGSSAHLTAGQRLASVLAIGFYAAAVLVVRGRAARRVERRYRWGTWALVAVLALSALANLASDSPWERFLLAPVALLLAGMCLVVARGADTTATV